MKWFSPMNRADSLFWRPKARTTAHPAEDLGGLAVDLLALLADVAEERADATVPDQVGIIDPRHEAAARPASSRQSTQARTTSPPRNWTTADQGL